MITKANIMAATSGADAVAGDIVISKKAWVDGSEIIGSCSIFLTKNILTGISNNPLNKIVVLEDYSGTFFSGQTWTGGYPNSPIDSDVFHHQVIGHVSTTYYLMVSTGRIYRYASGNYLMAESGYEWRTYKRIGNYWILDSYALKGGGYGMSNYTALDRCKSDVYTSDTFATVLMAESI